LQGINAAISEGIYAGKRVPLAAESNVVLKATHSFNAHNSVDIVSRMVGKAPMGNDLDNKCARNIPAAEFVDFAYRYGARKETGWSLLFAVDNLLDRQTYSVGYTNGSCSAYNVYPDDGRRLRVRASYDFK
jgi:outer membrane receptor protein involved in Fe transport